MIRENFCKKIGIGLGLMGVFIAPTALAQTPVVSASVHISGSCADCDLSDRSMPRLSLRNSNFSNSNFSRSNLSGGKFHGSNLSGASFQKAYLMRVEGENINMRGAVLRDASLIEAKLKKCDISQADLRRADLTRGDFTGTHFLVSNFIDVDAVDAVFVSSDFTGAKLNNSDFTGADFTSAVFTNVEFGDAIVYNANFTKADLSGANLRSAQGLTQKQINLACGNDVTKLPGLMYITTCVDRHAYDLDAALGAPLHLVTASKSTTFFLEDEQHFERFVIEKPGLAADTPTEIDLALREVEAAMRDLPIESPTRKRLSKARTILIKMQSK